MFSVGGGEQQDNQTAGGAAEISAPETHPFSNWGPIR